MSSRGLVVNTAAVMTAVLVGSGAWWIVSRNGEPAQTQSPAPAQETSRPVEAPLMPQAFGYFSTEHASPILTNYWNVDGSNYLIALHDKIATAENVITDLSDAQVFDDWTCGYRASKISCVTTAYNATLTTTLHPATPLPEAAETSAAFLASWT